MLKILDFSTRLATKDDAHLPTYDHTKLSAINTCPTWGILRYSMHMRMPGAMRVMPLEAGTAAHEAFSAVRWYQFYVHETPTDTLKELAMYQGNRLFPNGRFEQMLNVLSDGATYRTNCINFAIEAIESTDFHDDISDRNRTISNISESLIYYVDSIDPLRFPIWVRDVTDPKSDFGIENSFDVVVKIGFETISHEGVIDYEELEVRFTGKLDGLHIDPRRDNMLIIEENKTGARLDDAWLSQWILSHQITGYCIAAQTFTGLECRRALVSGMKIPIGKNIVEGIRKETVNRGELLIHKWIEWFVTTIKLEQDYSNNVLSAPMYTHSCNRYFRACSFLPLCSCDTVEDKEEVLEQMELDEWSPLDE